MPRNTLCFKLDIYRIKSIMNKNEKKNKKKQKRNNKKQNKTKQDNRH